MQFNFRAIIDGVYSSARRRRRQSREGDMGSSTLLMTCALVALVCGAPPPMDPDMAELAQTVRDSCSAETGAPVAAIERVNAGADLASEAGLKCYVKCVMETAGMLNDGEVDVEAVLALLPDAVSDRISPQLRACGTQPGADHCDIAYNTQVCWQKANKDDYFLI